MKIFIFADIEGATGVVTYDKQSHPETCLYEEADTLRDAWMKFKLD